MDAPTGGLSIGPCDAGLWDDYVAGHADATLYHHYAWKPLIERVFGHETLYVSASEGGQIRGVLPIVRMRSRLFGDYLVSVPFLNYGGPLADSDSIAAALMVEGAQAASHSGSSHFEVRCGAPQPVSWACRTDKIVMELTLPDSAEQLSGAIGAKLRAQVKRPLREGAVAATGGIELLDDFYRVFAENMRDLGTPVYAQRFFAEICAAFPNSARIVIVRIGGRPAAAAFLLGDGRRMEIPWASSLRRYNRLSVNMMLYWEVLRLAIEQGCEIFDFGRSSIDSGTYRFKRQWGAQPRQLYWYYWLPPGAEMPGLTPDNPKFQLAIAAWQKLPVWATRILGPPIVAGLP